MTYFHLGKPQTIIGAEPFHCRVRDGIGWDQFAMVARQQPGNGKLVGKRKRCTSHPPKLLGCYMVKSHGQLVRVSFTRYRASTPRLSTLWSTTDLQASLRRGRSYLGVGFPLRCFQRLSRPYVATRQCPWQDNRNTSGTSTPVLSY